jgi:hypothetical protein
VGEFIHPNVLAAPPRTSPVPVWHGKSAAQLLNEWVVTFAERGKLPPVRAALAFTIAGQIPTTADPVGLQEIVDQLEGGAPFCYEEREEEGGKRGVHLVVGRAPDTATQSLGPGSQIVDADRWQVAMEPNCTVTRLSNAFKFTGFGAV